MTISKIFFVPIHNTYSNKAICQISPFKIHMKCVDPCEDNMQGGSKPSLKDLHIILSYISNDNLRQKSLNMSERALGFRRLIGDRFKK